MTADAIASTVSQSDIGGSGLGRQALNSLMHYLVDKDGMIYSLMQDFYVARHAVGLDHIAIGIGNVSAASGASDTGAGRRAADPVSEAQIRYNMADRGVRGCQFSRARGCGRKPTSATASRCSIRAGRSWIACGCT